VAVILWGTDDRDSPTGAVGADVIDGTTVTVVARRAVEARVGDALAARRIAGGAVRALLLRSVDANTGFANVFGAGVLVVAALAAGTAVGLIGLEVKALAAATSLPVQAGATALATVERVGLVDDRIEAGAVAAGVGTAVLVSRTALIECGAGRDGRIGPEAPENAAEGGSK
jgi:hypothetical protein